jgi:hypothetical protein
MIPRSDLGAGAETFFPPRSRGLPDPLGVADGGAKCRQARHKSGLSRTKTALPRDRRTGASAPPSGARVVRAYFFLVAFLAPVLALGDLVAAFLVAFFAAAMSTLLVGHDQRDAKMRDNGTTLASRGTAPDITD